jgi:hypothetical protein
MLGRRLWPLALVGILCVPAVAPAAVIFDETFDGYTSFPDPGNTNQGIPEISEGAGEFWYAGRFGNFTGTSLQDDLAVAKTGGGSNSTPVGRVEDDAGLIFRIPAGFTNVTLTYDWRTSGVETTDFLVGGYFLGDLGLDQGANRVRDFFTDDFGGNEAAADAWWASNWTEFLRSRSSPWQVGNVLGLPSDIEVWVAFWMDDGEGDRGLIDNLSVLATPVTPAPEPSLMGLLALGLGVLCAHKRVLGRD